MTVDHYRFTDKNRDITVLASDYPLRGSWTFMFWFLWIASTLLLFRVIVDIFRRRDLGGFGKAFWAFLVIVLPWLGVLVYLIARGGKMVERDVDVATAHEESFRSNIRTTAGAPSTALALLALSALVFAACGSDSDSTDSTGAPVADGSLPAVGTSPTAADLAGRAFESVEVTGRELVDGSTIQLSFDEQRLSVQGGCNIMNGGYTSTDGVLEIEPLASTMMACEEPLMSQDTWLNEFLSSGPGISLDGETLTLTGTDTVITLAEIPDTELIGTSWTVTGTVANEAITGVPDDAVASITIADDGTVAVETGCNSGSGSVEITDTTLTFGPIATTTRACADEAVNELEALVLAALQGEAAYEISGDTMSIRSGDGADAVGLDFVARS